MAVQKKHKCIAGFCLVSFIVFICCYQSLFSWQYPVKVESADKTKPRSPVIHDKFDRWKRLLPNRTYMYSSKFSLDLKHSQASKKANKIAGLPTHIAIHVANSSINSSHINRTCFYFENGNIYKPVPWSKEVLKERHCSRRLPDAVIFGTRQCGTSELDFYLRTHPDIAFTRDEEMHFFGAPKERKGVDWYRTQMMMSKANQTTMEKTPKYFVRPTVPRQLMETLGNRTKLLLVIREPVERAMYDYLQLRDIWYDKGKELMDRWAYFNGTIDDYYFLLNSSFETTVLKSSGEVRQENALVYLGCYSFFLKRWLEYFPISQIHIVNLKDLEYDPVTVLKRVEKFLHISHYFSTENIYFNPEKQLHCQSGQFNQCAEQNQGRTLPGVNEDVLKKLENFYQPFNRQLCQMAPQTCSFSWM